MAEEVGLKSGVYGRVERGMMMPSVPSCGACARPRAYPRTCSCPWECGPTRAIAPAPPPGAGENPELK
ncbi:hypothetical protein [Vitiosangium sp. GDMCC 1.1324]|uniref:hypothetical protein n=1 Tax=Vitiosangium sp. (strain GDMCC 1.1324) TaxID=2138576 RepID=UPI001E408295|nr:hypothetical protein [Vitiosangium sp. GDMCC 1.1324]